MEDITRLKLRSGLLSLLVLLGAASADGQTASRIRLERLTQNVRNCTDIQSARDGSGRLFLVRQEGTIALFKDGVLADRPFLDIRNKTSSGGERGLLGLAFPPNFKDKKWFYVNYTDRSGTTTISRFQLVGSDPDLADASNERIILTIPQPYANHNGGQLQFGPDGFMYIGMGDGGDANDPQGNGQNRRALLGKMLRIDTESNLGRYEIPATNPFVSNAAYAPEIWALGLRNPWRFSFDRGSGDMYTGDVGQGRFEEIDVQPAASRGGENYGWATVEGNVCLRATTCDQTGLTGPAWVYPHSDGLSVTGGYVYRGSAYPSLQGTYLYGDFVSGRIWGLRRQGTGWSNELLASPGSSFGVSTFGEDETGELLVANYNSGEIFRILGTRRPSFGTANVVNAASFQPGLSPGSLSTIFATGVLESISAFNAAAIPLPRVLSEVRVKVNDMDAPLLAVVRTGESEQINFQAPWELQPGSVARIQLTVRGEVSDVIEVPVTALLPGIFGINATDALLIRARDFSLIASPGGIQRGEDYVLYATGLGQLSSPVANGEALTQAATLRGTSTLTLGGVLGQISYAGAAPGFVGVYQVNFRPGPATPVGSQDLTLTVDDKASLSRKVLVSN